MAPLARRPMLCKFICSPTWILLSRTFTQGATFFNASAASRSKGAAKPREIPQKSMRVASKEATQTDQLPNDLGLLEGTFVMPSGANKPSIVRLPRERLKLEWHRVKTRMTDLAGILFYKYGVAKKPNPRPKLALRNTGRVASALHAQMYTAFADGDLATLSQACTEGLFSSFRSRIVSRPASERLRWTLHKQIRRPRVVSHRAVVIPMVSDSALRQAVVKIQSLQTLEKIQIDGQVVAGTGEKKIVKEYVVVQRRMRKQKEEPWMVWGTVEESNWRRVVF